MQPQQTPAGVYASGDSTLPFDGHTSGVSWGAVLAGAAAASALSFILLILGFGLGLSAVSPWSYNVDTIGKTTFIWVAFMQLASAGMGGYLAGRLRVKWAGVHTDEVYFRDTAHGLLAWAVATLLMAALMAGAVRAALSGAIDAGAAAGGTAAQLLSKDGADKNGNPAVSYFSDVLLRAEPGTVDAASDATVRPEVARILVNDLRAGDLSPDDKQYLSRLVAKRSGVAPAEADRRVDDVYARLSKASADAQAAAKEAADKARKGAAHSALWMFVALLIGAFFASLCATYGGRQRDAIVRR
ncbi:MAG: hypothetical protein V4754_19105 [Pseudomonadota bacterium]